jgi:NAD-dependent dihydropyrimidine dehydrogenase PreA subunit
VTWRDGLAEVLEACLRLVPLPVRTGLRAVGRPGRESPVVLTGNYDLTVRRVLRALAGLDAWLVVANSRGVNVWCASSGGHLTTHQVVTALKVSGLENRVVHRTVILPQLAATGVEGKEVRRRTGWIVRFGPAHAADIPAYLAADCRKDEAMRRVRFGVGERLAMAAAWATPTALVGAAIAAALGAAAHVPAFVALVACLAVAVFFLYDRLPGGDGLRRAAVGGAALAAVAVVLALGGRLTPGAAGGWSATALAVVAVLTFDYAGSSPTAAAGLFEEKVYQIVVDPERCTGAWNCVAVCPEAVFEPRPEIHKVAITRDDRCIRCGACVVQCPQDALAFETPTGDRVGPETIRRYKLNLFGRRVA